MQAQACVQTHAFLPQALRELCGFWQRMSQADPAGMQIELHSIGLDGQVSRRVVPLIEDDGEPTPVDLRHVMPAQDFLTPVGSSKDAICAALDSLKAGRQKPCRTHTEKQDILP